MARGVQSQRIAIALLIAPIPPGGISRSDSTPRRKLHPLGPVRSIRVSGVGEDSDFWRHCASATDRTLGVTTNCHLIDGQKGEAPAVKTQPPRHHDSPLSSTNVTRIRVSVAFRPPFFCVSSAGKLGRRQRRQ